MLKWNFADSVDLEELHDIFELSELYNCDNILVINEDTKEIEYLRDMGNTDRLESIQFLNKLTKSLPSKEETITF